jgi:hypothetical protein
MFQHAADVGQHRIVEARCRAGIQIGKGNYMKIEMLYYFDPSAPEERQIVASMFERDTKYWPELVLIEKRNIEIPDVDIPSKESITKTVISNLNEQKTQILAETYKKVSVIDERINQLLCIESK